MNKNYNFWKKIWDSKGSSDQENLLFLNGYEHLGFPVDSKQIVSSIIETLGIEPDHSVLEVGCGCGFLSREFNSYCDYVGVDYSLTLIQKHKRMFDHKVYTSESSQLSFPNNDFDHVFCYGLFQYLPDLEYADKTISEMSRVSRKSVLLGDLKTNKTRDTHFVYPKEALSLNNYIFTKCFYDPSDSFRYNAYRRIQ